MNLAPLQWSSAYLGAVAMVQVISAGLFEPRLLFWQVAQLGLTGFLYWVRGLGRFSIVVPQVELICWVIVLGFSGGVLCKIILLGEGYTKHWRCE
jgi:hypothetical protein